MAKRRNKIMIEAKKNKVNPSLSVRYGEDLYKRASKKIGMTDAMIASYPDADALLKACNGMHSKSNPDARIKEGVPPVGVKFEEDRPDVMTLESILKAAFVQQNRGMFDETNLQSFLRNVNRRYGAQKPLRIVKDMSLVAVKHELVTKYTIYFKKG